MNEQHSVDFERCVCACVRACIRRVRACARACVSACKSVTVRFNAHVCNICLVLATNIAVSITHRLIEWHIQMETVSCRNQEFSIKSTYFCHIYIVLDDVGGH